MGEDTDDDLADVDGVIGETMGELELEMDDEESETPASNESTDSSASESASEPDQPAQAESDDDGVAVDVATDNLEGPFPEVLTIRVTEEHFDFMEGYVKFTDYESPAEIFREFIEELHQENGEEVRRRLEKLEELQGGL